MCCGNERQRTDDGDFAAEKKLLRHHRRNLATIADVDEKRFDKIILIVTQSNLSTVEARVPVEKAWFA